MPTGAHHLQFSDSETQAVGSWVELPDSASRSASSRSAPALMSRHYAGRYSGQCWSHSGILSGVACPPQLPVRPNVIDVGTVSPDTQLIISSMSPEAPLANLPDATLCILCKFVANAKKAFRPCSQKDHMIFVLQIRNKYVLRIVVLIRATRA